MKRMYKKYKGILSGKAVYPLMTLLLLMSLGACEEKMRFEIGYEDNVPPSPPRYIGHTPLPGGARIQFRIPIDEDLLSIDASYVNAQGKTVWFSASYFHDTINVYGFSDTLEQVVNLYAVDRAGNKSEVVPIYINNALEPAYSKIARSLILKPSFASLFMEWENTLRQNINIYAELSYTQNGQKVEHQLIYTSNILDDRWVIRDLNLKAQDPLNVKIRVEDYYGNITDYIDRGIIYLLEDEKIPKDKWTMPLEYGEYMGDQPMGFLSGNEGRAIYAIDDVIDDGKNMNYIHTEHRGRTGSTVDFNSPWNIFIDLGDEYELSCTNEAGEVIAENVPHEYLTLNAEQINWGRGRVTKMYFLSDGDDRNDGEDRPHPVAAIAVWDRALSDQEVASLGGVK